MYNWDILLNIISNIYYITNLFNKAFTAEFLSYTISCLSIHNVHSTKNDASQPRQSHQHDSATSKSPVYL